MTPFHRVALVASGGLVASVVAAALLFPPAGTTMAPQASLEVAAPAKVAAAPVIKVESEQLPGVRPAQTGTTVAEVRRVLNYDLEHVTAGAAAVPRVFLASIPKGLDEIREVSVRKAVFFKSVLPLVLQVNEEIRGDRRRLRELRKEIEAGNKPDAIDRLWLAVMARRYEVERGDIDALLRRVDVIPPSLALAQAAKESGWGTSRFAREGNALFGQWTYAEGNLVPEERAADAGHMIKRFRRLIDSVRAYALNLNTHGAYREFRSLRAMLRRDGRPLDGRVLAGTLTRYSERGAQYVTAIQSLISYNNLHRFDDARLANTEPVNNPTI